jgi:hypothetical protein
MPARYTQQSLDYIAFKSGSQRIDSLQNIEISHMSWATVQSEDDGKERTTLCVGNSQIDLNGEVLK